MPTQNPHRTAGLCTVQAAVENGGGNFAQFGFQLFLRDAGAALACHQVAEGLRGLDGEAVEVGVEADVLDEVFAGLRVEAALPGDFDAVDVEAAAPTDILAVDSLCAGVFQVVEQDAAGRAAEVE